MGRRLLLASLARVWPPITVSASAPNLRCRPAQATRAQPPGRPPRSPRSRFSPNLSPRAPSCRRCVGFVVARPRPARRRRCIASCACATSTCLRDLDVPTRPRRACTTSIRPTPTTRGRGGHHDQNVDRVNQDNRGTAIDELDILPAGCHGRWRPQRDARPRRAHHGGQLDERDRDQHPTGRSRRRRSPAAELTHQATPSATATRPT